MTFPVKAARATRLKALLVSEYVEVFYMVVPFLGIVGYGIHDHEHSGCECEKIYEIRQADAKRRKVSCCKDM